MDDFARQMRDEYLTWRTRIMNEFGLSKREIQVILYGDELERMRMLYKTLNRFVRTRR